MPNSVVLVAMVLVGCTGGTPPPTQAPSGSGTGSATSTVPAPTQAPVADKADRKVCCESFGYGSRMVECCFKQAWTKPDECRLAPGMVGGGMRVVDDAKCQGN